MSIGVENGGGDILVVDDTPANLRLLTGILQGQGYRVRPVPSGPLALRAAALEPPDLVLLDINMPEMDGYEVCRRLKTDPALDRVPVIFISALTETADKVQAFGLGGVDYVTKPFQAEEVLARVRTHLTLRRLQATLELHNARLEELVAAQVAEISQAQLATILALSKLAESRDDNTGKHLERVQGYCRILAERLHGMAEYRDQVTDRFIEDIHHASPLHDIGKVAIPDSILLKPGPLTEDEFTVMKTHTIHGAATLEAVQARYPGNSFINMGIEIARSHHEHWDGGGYPDGRSGSDIPLSARIMSIADVYDALTSERCYKPALTHERTLEMMLSLGGAHFDPALMPVLLDCADEFDRTRAALG
jgi:putative two-component system response regulator